MKYQTLLLFFGATIMWCSATTVAFAQDPAKQDHARLRAYTTVMPQSGRSLYQRSQNSSMLPLWTFNVSSTRDHNNYSGVMVGRNPFSATRRSLHFGNDPIGRSATSRRSIKAIRGGTCNCNLHPHVDLPECQVRNPYAFSWQPRNFCMGGSCLFIRCLHASPIHPR